MDWDSNGDISFGEFVYAFTKWVDVDGEDTADELVIRNCSSVREGKGLCCLDDMGWLERCPRSSRLQQ